MQRSLSVPLPGFSNLLGLFPSSCATDWRMFCQRPHDTRGEHFHFWCLIIGKPTLLEIVTWLPFGYPLQTSLQWSFQDKDGSDPGVVVCRENLELHTRKLLLQCLSVLIHFQDALPLARCLEGERPHRGTHCSQKQYGVVKEEDSTIQVQFFNTALNNCVLVVRFHPAVANLLSAVLDRFLELGICKSSVVLPVGADPSPVGV